LWQHDTFFVVSDGKLKLRQEDAGAWLIHYRRADKDSLMLSQYEIVPVAEPERIRAILSEAIGVLAEVRKRRVLMTRDNVRLHLDSVEGLGEFGEIEAVIADGDDPEASRAAVDELLDALEIAREELIEVSYFELLSRRSG
ncbi:MAG TPA: class IV adenylate cyclase, partial [Candidatus Binataceae bacterium]